MTTTLISGIDQLKSQLLDYLEKVQLYTQVEKTVLFFSYGEREERCKVWNSVYSSFSTAKAQLFSFLDQQYEAQQSLPEFLKFDFVFNIQKEQWDDVEQTVINQFHNNHYRKGISFDENFECCFLEQELYGRAIIRGLSYDKPNFFDEANLNTSILRKYDDSKKQINLKELQQVWTFDTYAVFYENNQLIQLQSQFTENGVRYLMEPKKQHFIKMIKQNAAFITSQIQEDGRFIYGCFPAYDRSIRNYNTIRHCTTNYALIETLMIDNHEGHLKKIRSVIDYALAHFYFEQEPQLAYMLDASEPEKLDEIKLGANAAAILMLTKYQELTGDDQYLDYAKKLANGILSMVNSEGETTHVLHYPNMELKQKFRIVYYDGEAALALLRLYQLKPEEKLLSTVKLMFERFISERYERYHDHWLSYCTNELTKICPEEKYFLFGMKNYLRHMIFIRNRKTSYATLLELMMAAYQMIERMKMLGLAELFKQSHFDDLKKLIEFRAEFQRTGFFYPEVAMYMARPDKILHAFYVRHDRFRVRIDDQEHNLSGYIAYVQHFENE
ncbi:poly alpha-glucosyltransferase [Acinetobacter venetianus]|uniref:poly alpha-glucosyltransferase n=1 Tax=Acinetobacter venetianus TaxID=52133 RepID=UPI00214FA37D|nr:poly alpha-glucosyltransferase [Acinetobacter venetianus]MCR4531740.1 poly alpha-glucosyltransferase [Acinetobacter venetianus]